jgi:hypothetical protein
LYKLEQNIIASGTCLNITTDNVTLEGNGFNLTGSQEGSGIYSFNTKNLKVYNFDEISNFSSDITLKSSNNSLIYNITSNSSLIGVEFIDNSQNNTLFNINLTSETPISNGNNNYLIYIIPLARLNLINSQMLLQTFIPLVEIL